MFLDTFMDDASEGIMQNPIPDLEDLQLEYAVSLEAAYNDFMLEGCQLEFQAIYEGRTEILNEGILSSIANFFKKIWRMICKVFGFGDGGGSSSGGGGGGGGASREYISKCRARMRKLMTRPESEIRKRLQSWKQIKIYSPHLFMCKLWHTDDEFIDHFVDILGDYCRNKDEKTYEYKQKDTNSILENIFEDFAKHNKIQIPQDISVFKICSIYSSHVKSILPESTTTLYDLVKFNGVDMGRILHGQEIDESEIDIKKAMKELDENLNFIDTYVSSYNEKTWKRIIDSFTKDAQECAETNPKRAAFACQMIKKFAQISIYVCNINRKLYASTLNTIYRALR